MSTFSLFWSAIGISAAMGFIAIESCVGFNAVFFTVQGTVATSIIFIGFMLGLGNGIILAIVTRLCFYPLTNPKLHRQVLTAISIVLYTSTSIVLLGMMMHLDRPEGATNYMIFVLAPSLIVGLSMGATSGYIARWYQKASGL